MENINFLEWLFGYLEFHGWSTIYLACKFNNVCWVDTIFYCHLLHLARRCWDKSMDLHFPLTFLRSNCHCSNETSSRICYFWGDKEAKSKQTKRNKKSCNSVHKQVEEEASRISSQGDQTKIVWAVSSLPS